MKMEDLLDMRLAALNYDRAEGALAEMEARVLARIAVRAERRNAVRMTGVAALGALALGIASPALLSSNATAAPFDPIGAATVLAPSTLLDAAR